MAFPTGVKAYWKLEDVSDVNGAYTLTNTGTTTFAAAKINNGADFGTSNSTKSLKNESIQATAYPITISGWAKPKVVNANDYIFSLADDTVHFYGLVFRTADSHVVFRSNNNTEVGDVDTGYVAQVDTWFHFVVNIIDTTHVTVYINGSATNTNASIYVATGLDRFILGALGRSTPIEHYSGLIDEVGYWGRSLTTQEVTDLYNAGAGLQPDLTTSLVSYWKLDESSGNADDAVSTNDLTNTGTVTYAAAKINKGADFSGANMILENAGAVGFTSGGDRTWNFWMKADVNGGYILDNITNSGAQRRVTIYLNGTNLAIYTWNTDIDTGQAISTGTWYMVTVCWSAGTITTYVNAVSKTGGTTGTAAGNANGFAIGSEYPKTYGANFNGIVDEVGVWSRVLTQAEITALYNSGDGKQYPFPTTQNYTLTGETGTLTLTGYDAGLGMSYSLLGEVGNFILSGYDAVLSYVGWKHTTKNSTTWTDTTKNTTTWTDSTKSDTTWSNQTKH
jgi:hypothetical protein